MRVKVGLVTSSSFAASRPATMPLVKVVLPLPRSPVSSTTTGGFRRLANSLPQSVVSSADRVMTSSLTPLQLPEELAPRTGNGGGNLAGHEAGLLGSFLSQVRLP